MSNTTTLRDHSEPCEHGSYEKRYLIGHRQNDAEFKWCPGGREVKVNWAMIERAASELERLLYALRAALRAALEVSDVE